MGNRVLSFRGTPRPGRLAGCSALMPRMPLRQDDFVATPAPGLVACAFNGKFRNVIVSSKTRSELADRRERLVTPAFATGCIRICANTGGTDLCPDDGSKKSANYMILLKIRFANGRLALPAFQFFVCAL